MKAARMNGDSSTLSDPGSERWRDIPAVAVALAPVPLAAQPTEYIRQAWAGRPYGQTAEAMVAAASDGDRLYVRVEWEDDSRPHGEFQDAAGVIFHNGSDVALATMGKDGAPVPLWYWENGRPAPLHLMSTGPGVVEKVADAVPAARALLNESRWSVVFSGPAGSNSHARLGVAVWNGSNEERAGLAAVSREWLPVELA
ncbi:MAG: hypothetical protein IT304_11085 [Dehalococcoidia bacterium]|nr:hypothetical protein [Dehalococcoidia bacterium]